MNVDRQSLSNQLQFVFSALSTMTTRHDSHSVYEMFHAARRIRTMRCRFTARCPYSCFDVFAQVEEAVAVLQAHQAKKDATQKVGSMANSAATATSWRRSAVVNWYDCGKTARLNVVLDVNYSLCIVFYLFYICVTLFYCFRMQKKDQIWGETAYADSRQGLSLNNYPKIKGVGNKWWFKHIYTWTFWEKLHLIIF